MSCSDLLLGSIYSVYSVCMYTIYDDTTLCTYTNALLFFPPGRTALVRKLELEAAHGRPESGSGRDRASDRDRNRRPRRDSPSYDRYRRRSRSRSRSRSRERGRRAARPVAPSQTKEFITSFEVAAEGGFPRVDDYVDDWERPGRGAEAAARCVAQGIANAQPFESSFTSFRFVSFSFRFSHVS